MKYQYHIESSDAESRKILNKKVLYLIDSGTAAQAGITSEDIYNAYTGDGGLHGLDRKGFDDYHSYSKAKKEIENGQFFTPPSLCQLVAEVLTPSQFDLVADLTCGKGSFFNFFPVESNLYGCELDAKACKVARYLFPTANIVPGDIRTYKPEVRFDYVVGNPSFNLRWWTEESKEVLSQLYYCQKANELLKPLGILALIVPQSFLADDFSDKAMIREMERRFSFLGQVGLPDNAFACLGVKSFPTKLQLWQKKSEAKDWKARRYLRLALRKQNQKPERDVIALVKRKDSFVYKAYSAKARSMLTGDMKMPVPVYQAILDNEPDRFPGFEALLRRKCQEYSNQSQAFCDMPENPAIGKWLEEFTLWDAENEEYIYLNDIQRGDINRMLQKRYGMLQWEQGSGKTLAAIAMGLYRMQNQGINATWVVSSAISIRNNWDVVLPNYDLSYVFVEELKDLAHIKPGDFALVTLDKLGMIQRHIKKWIRRHNQNVMLVLDESDEISNPYSKRAKVSLSCFRRCRMKLLTTGTSTRNNVSEFAPQLELLYNNSGMSQFYMRFIRFTSTEYKDIYFLNYTGSLESNLLQMVMAKEKINLFMKGQDTDLDQIYEKFGVDYNLRDLLMRREVDDDGKFQIRWGKQKIA